MRGGIHNTKKGSLLAEDFGVSYNLVTYLYKEKEVSKDAERKLQLVLVERDEPLQSLDGPEQTFG